MKRKKVFPRFSIVLLLLAAISAVLWLSHRFERGEPSDVSESEQPGNYSGGNQGAKTDPSEAARTNPDSQTTGNVAGSTRDPAMRVEGAGSPQELAEFIRQFAATGSSTSDLYRQLAALGLKDRPWWRNAEEVSALLDLASDLSVAEQYRVVAMSIYLAAAPQNQVGQNSTAIQQLVSDGSDEMVSAVLQGMADRSVAPAALTKATLTSATRGTGAKCHAWYAARLTQKNDAELAGRALAPLDAPMTEATKVGF